MKKKEEGITLVALVITIVILLILAGISISALTNQGLFGKAKEAKQKSENAQREEQNVLNEYEESLDKYSESGIKASDIAKAEDKSKYYGKVVTGYTPTNGATVQNWKIFYADSNNIYLIADDYVEREYLPASTNSSGSVTTNKPTAGNSSYARAAYFGDSLRADYSTGSARITDEKIKALNNSYFSQNFTSTNENMKAVAYMLDTKAWEGFKDANGKAEYVIGGPTIEMLMNSYSQKHGVQYKAKASSTTGYQISTDNGTNWKNNMTTGSEYLDTSDSLYVITSKTNAPYMWVASPSEINVGNLLYVNSDGGVNLNYYSGVGAGFRPIICLNSNVYLVETKTGFVIK